MSIKLSIYFRNRISTEWNTLISYVSCGPLRVFRYIDLIAYRLEKYLLMYLFKNIIIIYFIIIIISDSVDDRDQKPRYGIEVLLNLSRYQPALGNERINTK